VRDADYQAYWSFVCDGAEMQPYTPAQLAWFHALQARQDHVNRFIAQVGDTLPFSEAIPVAQGGELPQFIRRFDPERLGYGHNPFSAAAPAAQALAA